MVTADVLGKTHPKRRSQIVNGSRRKDRRQKMTKDRPKNEVKGAKKREEGPNYLAAKSARRLGLGGRSHRMLLTRET